MVSAVTFLFQKEEQKLVMFLTNTRFIIGIHVINWNDLLGGLHNGSFLLKQKRKTKQKTNQCTKKFLNKMLRCKLEKADSSSIFMHTICCTHFSGWLWVWYILFEHYFFSKEHFCEQKEKNCDSWPKQRIVQRNRVKKCKRKENSLWFIWKTKI